MQASNAIWGIHSAQKKKRQLHTMLQQGSTKAERAVWCSISRAQRQGSSSGNVNANAVKAKARPD
jgi:hypothetical protein